MKIFLLKGLMSLLLIIIGLIEFRRQKPVVRIQMLSAGLKKVSLILILFIGYLTLTLAYSSNPEYGFQKILNFIISIVPSIFVFYYLISTLTELRIKLFIYSLGVISVLTVSYIIIDYPFDQSTIYHYESGRWSHVIYGRMISSIAVVLLSYLMWMIGRAAHLHSITPRLWEIIFLIFVTSMAVYGTYLSALRAAFVGLMLVVGGLLVISAWFVSLPAGRQVPSAWLKKQKGLNIITKDQELSTKELKDTYQYKSPASSVLSALLIITIISALLIYFVPKPDIINFRLDNMTAFDDLQFKGDPAIHSRLDSWELSWEIIKEYPLLGTGIGGFNGYNNIEWTRVIKYSHNIILEFAVEGGVVGVLVLCSLFVVMFQSSYRFSKWHPEPASPAGRLVSGSAIVVLTFFLFAIWLSMFSKEFSNQSLLWIGLAFYGFKQDKRSKEKD